MVVAAAKITGGTVSMGPPFQTGRTLLVYLGMLVYLGKSGKPDNVDCAQSRLVVEFSIQKRKDKLDNTKTATPLTKTQLVTRLS